MNSTKTEYRHWNCRRGQTGRERVITLCGINLKDVIREHILQVNNALSKETVEIEISKAIIFDNGDGTAKYKVEGQQHGIVKKSDSTRYSRSFTIDRIEPDDIPNGQIILNFPS